MRVAVLVIFLMFSTIALGQESRTESSPEVGIQSGPLLPSRLRRVREIVQMMGLRYSHPTGNGMIEVELMRGLGHGITYNTGSIDYRLTLSDSAINAYLPIHFLAGFHEDYYTPLRLPPKVGGGWHFGAGLTQEITHSLLFRSDFKYRIRPGISLIVEMGLVYRFSATGPS